METAEKCALLFKMLCQKFDGSDLGKKAAQKMFYFFEREGISLNLRYGIYYYGPYSSKLDNMMHILESKDYISINTTGTTHIISLGNEDVACEVLTSTEQNIANDVISHFAHCTPMELEALTTMDYIAHSIYSDNYSKQQIVSKFKEIKGTKFSDSSIENAMSGLTKIGLLSA